MTRLEVHGLVNCANEAGLGGGGLDGCVHRAAGPHLIAECMLLEGIPTGTAKLTYGYQLPARWILHAVGPHGENSELLLRTYINVLQLARKHEIRSLAIPCISTGIFGYPEDRACRIALNAVLSFIKEGKCPEVIQSKPVLHLWEFLF